MPMLPKPSWKGCDVFVIGGGPSLSDFDWELLRDKRTIGCNDAFMFGPQICKVCIFSDREWWRQYEQDLVRYVSQGGVVFTNRELPEVRTYPWLYYVRRAVTGLHKDKLGYNGNTGMSAINLALILGAKRVFLLGFDMKMSEGQSNWHPAFDKTRTGADVLQKFAHKAQIVVSDWKSKFADREIINVTSDSALEGFPKVDPVTFWKGYENGTCHANPS